MVAWPEREKIEATIVSGGGFFSLKSVIQDSQTTAHDCVVARGALIGAALRSGRSAHNVHAGHQMSTPWDALHRAFFNGEALWT
jgi:hypothetical protein